MSTNGQGYMQSYLRSRRELLEMGVRQATATITNDERRFEAERTYYRDMVGSLDKQVLEYDKMLSKLAQERQELTRPLTSRTTRGSSSEKIAYGTIASGIKTLSEGSYTAAETANIENTTPPAIASAIAEASERLGQALNEATRDQISDELVGAVLGSQMFMGLDPGQRAATIDDMTRTVRINHKPFAINASAYLQSEGELKLLDPENRREAIKAREIELGKGDADKAVALGYQHLEDRGTTMGGGTSTVTRSELAPGERERLDKINSEGFRATAAFIRDDGELSDDERAQLAEASINPDEYLDMALMRSIARAGVLTAERGSLVGRRSAAQADLEAMVAPDTSDQRRRELTAMTYGPAGVTPTQALFTPGKVEERAEAQRKELTAKQAMLKGVMRAAAGDVPEMGEDDNVYASQLSDAVQNGNVPAIRETYDLMKQAGYSDERLTSSFAVASSRARQLKTRREAQAAQAAAPE